jgi:hypothetical protein
VRHLLANRDRPAREWDPRHPPRHADFAYLGALATAIEEALAGRDLTLVVTTEHRTLPVYGPDVVVIQRAGPDGRPPDYADRVLAVFKTHSPRPVLAARPGREPFALTATALASYAQLALRGAPSRLRRRGAVVEPIPLGFMWDGEVTAPPVDSRPVDVLFCGSVETAARPGLRGRLGTPKSRSRAAMLDAARRLPSSIAVDLGVTESFAASKHAGPQDYWARLAGAKVCLVPRGDTLETYRLFEAARAGCVLVGERLPSNWFYDGAPVIDQTGWRGLEACLRALLADPGALAERQRHTLAWYEACVSPRAVARHVATTVEAASPRRRARSLR